MLCRHCWERHASPAQDKGDVIMKTILITGSTDGIGKETAKLLASQGHLILLHGRSAEKLASVKSEF